MTAPGKGPRQPLARTRDELRARVAELETSLERADAKLKVERGVRQRVEARGPAARRGGRRCVSR